MPPISLSHVSPGCFAHHDAALGSSDRERGQCLGFKSPSLKKVVDARPAPGMTGRADFRACLITWPCMRGGDALAAGDGSRRRRRRPRWQPCSVPGCGSGGASGPNAASVRRRRGGGLKPFASAARVVTCASTSRSRAARAMRPPAWMPPTSTRFGAQPPSAARPDSAPTGCVSCASAAVIGRAGTKPSERVSTWRLPPRTPLPPPRRAGRLADPRPRLGCREWPCSAQVRGPGVPAPPGVGGAATSDRTPSARQRSCRVRTARRGPAPCGGCRHGQPAFPGRKQALATSRRSAVGVA